MLVLAQTEMRFMRLARIFHVKLLIGLVLLVLIRQQIVRRLLIDLVSRLKNVVQLPLVLHLQSQRQTVKKALPQLLVLV